MFLLSRFQASKTPFAPIEFSPTNRPSPATVGFRTPKKSEGRSSKADAVVEEKNGRIR